VIAGISIKRFFDARLGNMLLLQMENPRGKSKSFSNSLLPETLP